MVVLLGDTVVSMASCRLIIQDEVNIKLEQIDPFIDIVVARLNEIEFERDYANDGEGLHKFVDPEDGQVYLYTQGEPYHAHKYFLAFDQPDLKGTFKISAEGPKEWQSITDYRVPPSRGGVFDTAFRARANTHPTPRESARSVLRRAFA